MLAARPPADKHRRLATWQSLYSSRLTGETAIGLDVDAVVVGSGFGGSAAACRLAEEDRSVLVLERGKRYPPGSFPRRPAEMSTNFWDPSEGLHGLFDIWSFRGLEAVVAAGLGGGSLIYANVLIRKPPEWFVREDPRQPGYEYWPVTYDDLEPYYERAEEMLGATPYPFEHEPYASTPKTLAHREGAERIGLPWRLPQLAVTFGAQRDDPRPGEPFDTPDANLHGRQRLSCRLCGECDIGCNEGSKNTTDLTYLSRASRAGADIRDRHEVRRIAPRPGGGFTVGYVVHDPDAEGAPTPTSDLPVHEVTCRVLVLSAGTLGTTYLLLSNRSAFPGLSARLGTRFCGNGDLLGFLRSERRRFAPSLGPVITSTSYGADTLDDGAGRGFYIQDGGYPLFAEWIAESYDVSRVRQLASVAAAFVVDRFTDAPKSRIGTRISTAIGDGQGSAGTLPMLGMGRDVPDGVMRLREGWLDIDWTTETSREFFDRVEDTMRRLATALDADHDPNPLSYLDRVVTVHPLGGAPMGRDIREGVVDDRGEAFGYQGLFVADGAMMPGPVGPNPALTITALAERSVRRMLERTAPGRR